jgi:hypothetical protein
MHISNLLWFWEFSIWIDARLAVISLSCLFFLCVLIWDVNPYASAYLSWLQPGVFTDLTEEGLVAFYVFYFRVSFVRLVGHFGLWTILPCGVIRARKTMRHSRTKINEIH